MILREDTYRLRPITSNDMEFLYRVYASTREWEQALFGMNDEQWDAFLRMQFKLQHTQYMQNYNEPSFDVVMIEDIPAGRLYVSREQKEIRIVDISMLPEYRGLGIGGSLMRELLREGDEKGLPVTLHVEKNNRALEFYRRLGFRVEEDRGVYLFMIHLSSEGGRGV